MFAGPIIHDQFINNSLKLASGHGSDEKLKIDAKQQTATEARQVCSVGHTKQEEQAVSEKFCVVPAA